MRRDPHIHKSRLTSYYDGLAAAKIDLNPHDVIVLDRDLPGVHGDTICRMVSERDNPAMVLMLTAADAPGDRVGGFMLGADDYLPKPFPFPELVWDENADPFTKTVPVTMGRLRRKLGEPQVIQTIPGAGYRIADAPSPDRRPGAVSGGTGPTP